jgi:hypothetical protein
MGAVAGHGGSCWTWRLWRAGRPAIFPARDNPRATKAAKIAAGGAKMPIVVLDHVLHDRLMLLHVTTRYNEIEDRIEVSLMPSEGAGATIWLTHRLLERLWQGLFARFSTVRPGRTSIGVREAQAPPTAKPSKEDLLPRPKGPWDPADGHIQDWGPKECWLASEVDLTVHANGMTVTLRQSGVGERSIHFDDGRFFAWLEILRQCHRKAGWREPEWPFWMELASDDAREQVRVLH